MSEQPRRRLRPAPAPRRVGEPNVLSNQATPNTLSTPTTAARSGAQPTNPARPLARPASAQPSARPANQADPRFERPAGRGRRLPSFGTIIFIGFLILTAARWLNGLDFGGGGTTATPGATPRGTPVAATPVILNTPGKVTFGESNTDNGCDLVRLNTRFQVAIDVWWQAEMKRVVDKDETVLYVATLDGKEIDRYTLPPDPDVGAWQRLCGSEPVPGDAPGQVRVEVWNEGHTELLSQGQYTRYDVTAQPTPTSVPRATFAPGTVGTVYFGTELGEDCEVGKQNQFPRGVEVWWRAELLKPVARDAKVLVATLHDGRQISLEFVADVGSRAAPSVICASDPSPGVSLGVFTVEIWDEHRTKLLAIGEFERTQ